MASSAGPSLDSSLVPPPSESAARDGADAIDQVLSVSPSDLRIQCLLGQEVQYQLTLRNLTEEKVAYKVKTTRPKRYIVKPTQGLVWPSGECCVSIILGRMNSYPDRNNPRNLRDKFLVQSLTVPVSTATDDLTSLWKTLEKEHDPRRNQPAYHEQKLRCKLVVPTIDEQTREHEARHPEPLSHDEHESVSRALPDSISSVASARQPPPLDPSTTAELLVVAETSEPEESDQRTAPLSSESPAKQHAEATAADAVAPKQLIAEPPPTTTTEMSAAAATQAAKPKERWVRSKDVPEQRHRDHNSSEAPRDAAELPPATESTPTLSRRSRDNIVPGAISASMRAAGVNDDGGSSAALSKAREYDKLLSYTVKLTAEREAIEAKLQMLKDQNLVLMRENDALRNASTNAKATATAASAGVPPTLLDALQDSDVGRRRRNGGDIMLDAAATTAAEGDAFLGDLPSGASGVQLWQVLVIAVLSYCIGRLLA